MPMEAVDRLSAVEGSVDDVVRVLFGLLAGVRESRGGCLQVNGHGSQLLSQANVTHSRTLEQEGRESAAIRHRVRGRKSVPDWQRRRDQRHEVELCSAAGCDLDLGRGQAPGWQGRGNGPLYPRPESKGSRRGGCGWRDRRLGHVVANLAFQASISLVPG